MRRKAKSAKRPKARKLRRNPIAQALRAPTFRPRVAKPEGTYRRRPKHPAAEDQGI